MTISDCLGVILGRIEISALYSLTMFLLRKHAIIEVLCYLVELKSIKFIFSQTNLEKCTDKSVNIVTGYNIAVRIHNTFLCREGL
jgi:hypothetical protein